MSNFAEQFLDDILGFDIPQPQEYKAPVEKIKMPTVAALTDPSQIESQQRKAQKRRRSQASTMEMPSMNTPALQPSGYYQTTLG